MTKRHRQVSSGRAASVSGMTRRGWIGMGLGGAAAALLGERWWRPNNPVVMREDAIPITVYASPSCGCCHAWVAHLKAGGFHVTVESIADVSPVKRKLRVPEVLWSCHTGMVAGYTVEGHVPAGVIQRMLRDRPSISGLAVPRMPAGSPGMEGGRRDFYPVMAFGGGTGPFVYATP